MLDPLLLQSARSLARQIRQREVTSTQVVEAHIRQVERCNPQLNAMVQDRFAEARAEAQKADDAVRTKPEGELPPLHGVPCSIKECFALEGMPNTSGLMARKGQLATHDATAVKRLRAAGAIPLGVTNLSELCMWMESNNRVYGRTNNPYNLRHIVGGSSGGEGAIVAAAGTPFGLGSDVGGSIRMPAFFNGIFGHKPTGGLIPNTGQYPCAENDALRYLTTGPLAKKAEDLMPLVRLMAGPDGEDSRCIPFELGDPHAVDLREVTVLDVEDNGTTPVSDELREAQRDCVRALTQRGMKVTRARFKSLESSFDIWSSMLGSAGGKTFAELMGNGAPFPAWKELARVWHPSSAFTLPGIVLALLEPLGKVLPARTQRFIDMGRALRAELADRLGPNGVMLYPSFPVVAPRHRAPLLTPFQFVYTGIINVLEMPSTQVPIGLSASGLPLGIQVVGSRGRDHVTIAVALALEEAFGGWVVPKMAS